MGFFAGGWLPILLIFLLVILISVLVGFLVLQARYQRALLHHHRKLLDRQTEDAEFRSTLQLSIQMAVEAQFQKILDDTDWEQIAEVVMEFDGAVFEEVRRITKESLGFPVYKLKFDARPYIFVKLRASSFCIPIDRDPIQNLWVEVIVAISRIAILSAKYEQQEALEEYLVRKMPLEYASIILSLTQFFGTDLAEQGGALIENMSNYFMQESMIHKKDVA